MASHTSIAVCGVVPLAGAWIEIIAVPYFALRRVVVPLAGAWIEIAKNDRMVGAEAVVPLAGAWIEMSP